MDIRNGTNLHSLSYNITFYLISQLQIWVGSFKDFLLALHTIIALTLQAKDKLPKFSVPVSGTEGKTTW